jgi:TetR/AcrR family transcriptional regulator
LIAAEKAFGVLGFERATLADIAAEVGIRRPSLLYHFESKDILYKAVIRQVFDALQQALVAEMKPAPFDEQLKAVTKAFLEFVDRRAAFAPLILRDVIDGTGHAHDILVNEIVPVIDMVEEWLISQRSLTVESEYPVRQALLQVCTVGMFYAASGSLKETLWNGKPLTYAMSNRLFFG